MPVKKTKDKKNSTKQKKQLAIITVVLMIVSVVGIMLLTPGFNIKEIKVTGNSVLKTEDIIAKSGIKTGINIFDFSVGKAKKNILSMGYIEEVKIKRKLPSTVEITVVEEVGVAYIKADKGYVIITADGRCIDITDGIKNADDKNKGSMELPQLPLVTGLEEVKYKLGKTITSGNSAQLDILFKCLHEFSRQGYIFNMIEIDMSRLDEIKFYYLNRELCVIVGSADKVSYKMESFGTAFNQIMAEKNTIPKGVIDLSRVDAMGQVVHREPEPPAGEEKEE